MERLTMYRGDGRILTSTFTLDGVAWPIPVDAIVTASARRRYGTDIVWTHDNDAVGGVTSDTNVVTITVTPDDTNDLEIATSVILVCDVEVSHPAGDWGPFTNLFELEVLADITRPA